MSAPGPKPVTSCREPVNGALSMRRICRNLGRFQPPATVAASRESAADCLITAPFSSALTRRCHRGLKEAPLFLVLLGACARLEGWAEDRAVNAAGGGAAATGPYALTDTAGQPAVGHASSTTYTLADGFWNTLYAAPVVPDRSMAVRAGQSGTVSTLKLLARTRDEDDDPRTVTAVSGTSSQGGTVTLAGGVITYTAPAGFTGTDAFTYTVADNGGDTATGTVRVSVTSGVGANIISMIYAAGPPATFTVRFTGLPGATYRLQASSDLATWTSLLGSERTVPASGPDIGVASFVENVSGGARYYRTVYVSGP